MMVLQQDYKNAFNNTAGSSFEHIREMLAAFIVSEVISPNGKISFQTIGFELDDIYYLCNRYLIHKLYGWNDEYFV
jgi:hypothetical protein